MAANSFVRACAFTQLACLFAAPAAAQDSPGRVPARPIGASVVKAAGSERPVTFAAALAVAKIPAGMILPAGERLTVEPFLPDASEAPTESLNDASAAFASRNKGYLVDHRAGVLTIEPRTPTPCSLAVRRRAPGVVFNGSLHEGLGSLFSAMNPSPSRVPHGLMGDSSIIPTLALKLDAQPLDELLGAVAQHRPGFVWLFREHQMKTGETVCVFEYFYEGYRISTPWYVPSKGR